MLEMLFAIDPTPQQLDLDSTWARIQSMSGSAFDVAVRAATGSDRLAWVFAAGYHGALQRAFAAPADRKTALCVTEQHGNTPKAIECRWEGGRLSGDKAFVTMGAQAGDLLVLASRGEEEGQKDLVLVKTPISAPGVSFGAVSIPIVPEIPHASVSFDATPAELLEEQAWPVIKRFRFVEDLFVLGTTLAWFLGMARFSQQHAVVGEQSALMLAARAMAGFDPDEPAVHIAYAGVSAPARRLFEAFDWTELPIEIAERWTRDRALLDIARKAREIRTARAYEELSLSR